MSGLTEAELEEICLDYLRDAGWTTAYGPDLAPDGTAPERLTHADVFLHPRLMDAVRRLNPGLPESAVLEVVTILGRAESQVLLTENWRLHELLTHGVPVEFATADGSRRSTRAWLVNWTDINRNDWVAVNQMTVVQDGRTRRPDIVCFVNGLPLALFELKAVGSENATLKGAHNQLRTYQKDIPALFAANAVCVITDGHQARLGTMTTPLEHFAAWKTIDGSDAPPALPQMDVLVHGVFDPARFLDLVRNFVVFSDEPSGVVKRVAKYHQFWAVNTALESTIEASSKGDGRAGVVWHTQGSGKSLEMLFYAGKVMRHPAMANPTLVLLTDRNDLDDQLFDEVFTAARTLPEKPQQAESREDLKRLLTRASGGIVFTTLQKFGLSKEDREAGRPFPTLTDRRNVVVIADEAHRSQYDFIDGLARNLRDALPNASFIGFTGTPIESADKNTRQVFGDYVHTYDMTRSVEDEATVKVFYEARLAKVDLPPEHIEDLDEAFERATSGTEDAARERLKSRWAKVEAIVGSEQRVREVAKDIVAHWENRSEALTGKALVVGMSRRICAALYDEIVALRPEWHSDDDAEGAVKVVIAGSAADDEQLQPHIRDKKRLRALKQRAKDPDDPLQIVIVRDMWLTGFDSPSMHTMYVDKPMRGAGLMQAIARVNRTFKDKPSGLVVDYIGIADDLQEALADYTDRDRDVAGQSVEEGALPGLIEKHEVVTTMLHGHDWQTKARAGTGKSYLAAISACVDHLLGAPEVKGRFMEQVRYLVGFFTMSVPNPKAMALRDDVAFFQAVRASISKLEGTDSSGRSAGAELDTAIKQVLSEAMAGGGVIDIFAEAGMDRPDLSLIDDEFIEKVRKSPRPNLQIEMLRRLINEELGKIGKRNIVAGRQFSEMLQKALLAYQNRSIDAAQVVAELVELAKHLKGEQDRGARLKMNEAELAFYDAIRTNDAAVLAMEDEALQEIARELVEVVKRKATIDWNNKQTVRAALRSAVKRLLITRKYPPDKREEATDLVLQQAELLATDWAA